MKSKSLYGFGWGGSKATFNLHPQFSPQLYSYVPEILSLSGLADGIGKNVGVGCSSLNSEKICFGLSVFVGIGTGCVEVAVIIGKVLSVGSGVTVDAQETRKIDTKRKRVFWSLINFARNSPTASFTGAGRLWQESDTG